MAKSKKMTKKSKVDDNKVPNITEEDTRKALTKLAIGLLHGAKLESIDCIAIVKHIRSLEKVSDQVRILIEQGVI